MSSLGGLSHPHAENTEYDIIILGGGAAACATAIALHQHCPQYRVALVEKNHPQTWAARIGETLPPAAATVLQHLGLWQSFLAQGFRPSPGVHSRWGQDQTQGNAYFYQAWGPGWHLDRCAFDRWLVSHACARGADYWAPWQLHSVLREGTEWQVQLGWHNQGAWHNDQPLGAIAPEPRQQRPRLRARFLIDASGRQASLATRLGARRVRHDRLLAAHLYAPLEQEQDGATWIEALPHGWWYSAPLAEQQLVLCFMTDSDLARTLNLSHESGWREQLALAGWTRQRLKQAWHNLKPQISAAHSQHLQPLVGPGWLAVGDAASCFDPLSSLGLFKALRNASLAAYALADALAATRSGTRETQRSATPLAAPLEKYAALVGVEFQHYLARRQQYYAAEQRYAHLPFWQRRSALPKVAVGLGAQRS